MYWFSETVPANTTKEDPKKVTWLLDYGFISKLLIIIPAGVSGLAGIRLLKSGSQFMPRNLGSYIFGDNLKLEIPVAIEMYDRPFTIDAIMYNIDDTYDHTFIVGFSFLKGKPSIKIKTFAQLAGLKI